MRFVGMKTLKELCTAFIVPQRDKPKEFGGSIPWCRIEDIDGKYLSGTKSDQYVTEETVKKMNLRVIPKGAVICSCSASLGVQAILTEDCITNQTFIGMVPSEQITKDFLYYFLKSKTNYFKKIGTGTTIPYISRKKFEELCIPTSSLQRQDEIVSVLEKTESVIELRNNELKYLDDLIKARFVEMFGEPIANPMQWEVKPLKDMSVLITNGNTPKGGSDNYVNDGILFLRSQNVWRNRIELDDVAYIDEATHAALKKSSLHNKDILITKTGRINTENSSLGRAALFIGEDDSANINGHVYLVRLDGSVVPEFVVAILTGEAYRRYIRKVCVGGIDKRQINLDQVEEFPIILPPYEQQQSFAEFKDQVDKSKVVVQKALDETQLLFDSLMQKYFG